MRDAQLYLELAQRLAVEHQGRSGSDRLYVVPVLVDDLEQGAIVAKCLASLIGGEALGTESTKSLVSRTGHGNVAIKAAVEAALTLDTPFGTRRVVVEQNLGATTDGGHVPFTLSLETTPVAAGSTVSGAASGAPAFSGAEEEMLGLAAAVLDQGLLTGEIAVVLYDETGMDLKTQGACWSLLVDQLGGLPLAPLRTLVALVGASPRVERHCRPGRGCLYAIADGRLQQRKPLDNAGGDATWFASKPASPRVLFLGAGFSFSSNLPLGNSLRDTAIRRYIGLSTAAPSVDSDELARRLRAVLNGDRALPASLSTLSEREFADQLTLEQVLAFENVKYGNTPTLTDFALAHDRSLSTPGSSVVDLVAMLERPHKLILVTVNFDELLERTAPAGRVHVFAEDDDFVDAPDYIRRYLAGEPLAVPYLKLHGTISRPASCVVTVTQTEQGVSKAKRDALQVLSGSEHSQSPMIYVGASMRDIDLAPILTDHQFGRGVDERWVAPLPDPNVERFAQARRRIWAAAGTSGLQGRLITEISDEFLRLLRERWQ